MTAPTFADFVRKRTIELHLTQGELAQRAGLSRQAVVKLLSGDTLDPQISTVDRLAQALGVSPLFLLRLLIRRSVVDRPIQQASREVDDHSAFIADLSVPNGTIVSLGARFLKIWEIQNAGNAPWIGRWLGCQNAAGQDSADVLLVPDTFRVRVPDCKPGAVVRLEVWFTAPASPCNATSVWKMEDDEGRAYFPALSGLDCTVTVASL